ncbi:MAG TPA: hypothetical protein VFP93_03115 [Gammaproteobacteria bacterium]|nr:hypothetical protein [Gammaproteobacteria bacterium]
MRYIIVNLQDFIEVNLDTAFDVIAEHGACYVGAKAIWYAFRKSESFFNHQEMLLKGQLTKAEFIKRNQNFIASFQMSEKEFISAWNRALCFSPNFLELLTFQEINQNSHCRFIFVADINRIHFSFIKNKFQLENRSNEYYFSYDFGVTGNDLLVKALADIRRKSPRADIAIAYKPVEYPGYFSWILNPKKNILYRENESKHKILQRLASEYRATLISWSAADSTSIIKFDFCVNLQKWLDSGVAHMHFDAIDLPEKVNDLTFALDKLKVTPDSSPPIQARNSPKNSEKIRQKTQINSGQLAPKH